MKLLQNNIFHHLQVHYRQVEDRSKLHIGIERDLERQSAKKMANLHNQVQQEELTKAYRKVQEAEDRAKNL